MFLPPVFVLYGKFGRGTSQTIVANAAAAAFAATQRGGRTMEIKAVDADKKRYLSLLLLAEEQEDMIDRSL